MLQIILAILLLIPSLCNAQATRMSNGAAATSGASILTGITEEPPASGEESLGANGVFACSWEDGSDNLNTGGGTGHVWSSASATTTQLTRSTTSNGGWNNENHFLDYTDNTTPVQYLIHSFTSTSTLGYRFAFQLTSEALADGDAVMVAQIRSASSVLASVYVRQAVGGAYELVAYARASGNTDGAATGGTMLGSPETITTGTWYQIELLWQKNTANGAGWKLWNEAGTSSSSHTIGAGVTTYNLDSTMVYLGYITGVTFKNMSYQLDIVKLDTAGYPGPRVVE